MPDGIVNRSCHGTGVLVIRCPFRCKDSSFKEAATQGSFCLEEDGDSLRLKEDHAYYYGNFELSTEWSSVSGFITFPASYKGTYASL